MRAIPHTHINCVNIGFFQHFFHRRIDFFNMETIGKRLCPLSIDIGHRHYLGIRTAMGIGKAYGNWQQYSPPLQCQFERYS